MSRNWEIHIPPFVGDKDGSTPEQEAIINSLLSILGNDKFNFEECPMGKLQADCFIKELSSVISGKMDTRTGLERERQSTCEHVAGVCTSVAGVLGGLLLFSIFSGEEDAL